MELKYCMLYKNENGECMSIGKKCNDVENDDCVTKFRASSQSSLYKEKMERWINVRRGDETRWRNK